MSSRSSLLVPWAFFLILACSLVGTAQRSPRYSRSDRIDVILAVLRNFDFDNAETCCDRNRINTLYVIEKSISAKRLPRRKFIRFEIITEKQADTIADKGVEYYSFENLAVHKAFIRIDMARTFRRNGPSGDSNGGGIQFTCWKKGKRWVIKGILMGSYAS
jgi:hypothetical protein